MSFSSGDGSRRGTLSLAGLVLTFVLASIAAAPLLAQDAPLGGNRYRPGLDFRTLSVGRFDIHFHQGEEILAQRLARIVEHVAPELERRFGAPSGRVRIVLVDQTDVSNGWATVIPYNLIEIAAAPPTGRSLIGNTDDWLRLVFTHEYTHVLHLEKSGGWFGSLRRVFGRVPLFYPNLFVPDWQIEGLATYQESASTRQGRIPAGDFRSMLDTVAREGAFPALDQATGAVIDWPGGASAYVFGGYFHQFLADAYGPERLTRLADETASRLPFTGSLGFREIYGKSLGDLWQEFRDQTMTATSTAAVPNRTQLTKHGFTTASPVFTRDGRLFYAAATPHGFPSLNEVLADGTAERVADRYHGSRVAVAGDLLVFDQLQLDDNVALVSDLYVTPVGGGPVTRLTAGARAADPDVSPDGRTIVCTVQQTGRRILATLPLDPSVAGTAPVPLVDAAETEFSAPRWSPDGRFIVAERRTLGGPSEIVLVDSASREVRTLLSTRSGRLILPTWVPDGRAILFSTDREAREFTLYAMTLADGVIRRIEGAGPGAQSAAFSPDGTRLVLVGLSAGGFDLYSVPAGLEAVTRGAVVSFLPEPVIDEQTSLAEPLPSSEYSPWSTLLPRFWIPYAETDGDDTVLGAGTAGFDALGRHAYSATAGWAVPSGRADVHLDYTYSRWWPSLFVALSDETDAWREGDIHTRELNAGVLLPWRRVRWGTSILAAASTSTDGFERASDAFPIRPDRRRDALRLGWSLTSARAYGYSISTEEGGAVNVVTEFASGGPSGQRGSATSIAGSVRGYLRTWPAHGVLAVRGAGATSRGDAQARREFSAGGSGPRGGGFGIGVDAIGLMRGFSEGELSGRSVAVVNTDYRFPLGWPQRGLGTWPVFLQAVHGAVFVDLGQAWDTDLRASSWHRSIGGELSLDTVLSTFLPMTIAGGVAWRYDPRGSNDGVAFFARIGRAF